ncbi:HAMP domain-containing histidine kinase [Leptothermofonsia sichuanensis E412]|uniref:sensor histidine kinase n=1 Tax=Leptothermofonsia sichuanensis TaxID=2917832 RepID=UPI001CA72570|nr:ATP-binding protein [Leptothermofonsia sichuanensis]QZZ22907.1 HAMP domain-containing histidine kinase [Leptothermofonsia sichuanensis E412]
MLGVAVGGSLVGFGLGGYLYHRAEMHLADALDEKRLPAEFEIELIRSKLHRQHTIAFLENKPLIQQEVEAYRNHTEKAKQLWAALKASYAHPSVDESEAEQVLMKRLVQDYDSALHQYFQKAETLFNKLTTINSAAPTAEQASALRREWLELAVHPTTLKLRNLVDDLDQIIALATEEEQAATLAVIQAETLERQIIAVSLALAGILAAVFAWFLSRAITQPLETTTQIANRVIQEQNFDLQVPQTAQDEVGILTDTMNHLIRRVKRLLQERKAAEAQLVHAEKMASLGQLVAGVAHEINNPVNFIHGNLIYANEYMQQLLQLVELVEQCCVPLPPVLQAKLEEMDLEFVKQDSQEIFRSMRVGTERIREIVLALRIFSRLDEAELKAVDIHEGIESTLMILGGRLKKLNHLKIQVIKDYGQLPLVECYAGQLNQVFMNILTNAIDALEEHCTQGKQTVDPTVAFGTNWKASTAGTDELSEPGWIKIKTYRSGNNSVSIHIGNSGGSIPDEVKARMFDPFFTTKPVGKGTGLGLSISHQIITEKHHGTIQCFSKPDQWTEFAITIPIQQTLVCS